MLETAPDVTGGGGLGAPAPSAAIQLAWRLLSQEGLRMRQTEQQYLPI